MSDSKKSTNSRRNLLKSLAAGSGAIIAGKSLPDKWARPVVNSVLLPVHAQTSGGPFGATNNVVAMLDNENLFASLSSSFIKDARADTESFDFAYCITAVSETIADVAVLVTPGDDCTYFAYLYTLEGVEVNSGPQNMGGYEDLCNLQIGSAGKFLDKTGLVKNAHASITTTIELTNIQGHAAGILNYDSDRAIDEFSFGGSCPDMTIGKCCK